MIHMIHFVREYNNKKVTKAQYPWNNKKNHEILWTKNMAYEMLVQIIVG